MTMIVHEDCDPTVAKDKKLPYTAFIVEYMREGRIAYDIAVSTSQVELFDTYYFIGLDYNTNPYEIEAEYEEQNWKKYKINTNKIG